MDNEVDLPYYLYLSRIKGLGSVKFNRILRDNKSLKVDIKTFFKTVTNAGLNVYSYLSEDIKAAISEYERHLSEEQRLIDTLKKRSIFIVTILNKHYPFCLKDSLGLSAPPILYVKGNLSLLGGKHLAIVGSRRGSKLGIEIAQYASKVFSSYKFIIISGNANGIDKFAHYACLEVGGSTVFVIGTGILQYLDSLHPHSLPKNSLVISEFYPTVRYHKGYLMARNNTICGLARAVLVIEASRGSGTFYTGKSALMMGKPTFVVDYYKQDACYMGNKDLINKGATSIVYRNISQVSGQFHNIVQSVVAFNRPVEQYEFCTGVMDVIKWHLVNYKPFPIVSYDMLKKL